MPELVADVGNSRIKLGLVEPTGITSISSLEPKQEASWDHSFPGPRTWTIAGSDPVRRDAFASWLRNRGDSVYEISAYHQIPIEIALPHPERIGHDRLLNALAASRSLSQGDCAILISVGTAVTADRVEHGVFLGGAIFPGLRLMAQSLHDYTAKLPKVEIAPPFPYPGRDTEEAIRSGIINALCGGIERILSGFLGRKPGKIFLTGGDAELIAGQLRYEVDIVNPHLTLEGIRLALPGDRK